jgi:PAS domain S-box-containing protein
MTLGAGSRSLKIPDATVLAAALDAAHVAVTITDIAAPDSPLVYVNAAFEAITGYDRAEVLGRNCRFLQGPETDPEAVETLRAAIATRRRCDVELLNYRRDGEAFWNSLHLAPLQDRSGATTAYIGFQRDVSQERWRREQKEQHERMLALGRLAGGVAHEINNLLQPVLTLPDLAAERLPPDAQDARDDLRLVTESARDARAIVRRILDFGRVPDGARQPVSFAPALEEAVAACRATLPDTVSLECHVIAADVVTLIDKAEVKQILHNLVANAVDAMKGRGSLVVEVIGSATGLRWRVVDTGPGVPASVRSRIFEPFCGTKPAGRGTGLGLFIVHEIVRRAGGDIRVTDTPGGGATFVIDLPSCAPSDAPAAAANGPVIMAG